jgi:hypothetical protein
MQFTFLKEIRGTHGRERAIPISYMISPSNETSARNEITTLKKGDARNERLILGGFLPVLLSFLFEAF